MQSNDGVQIDQVTSMSYFTDRDMSDFYSEITVRNSTGVDIYFARADGDIFTVPATSLTRVQDPHVEIRILVRAGRPDPDQRFFNGSPALARMKMPTKVITISYDRLLSGVVFIPELGVSCALGKHIARLQDGNCLGDEYRTRLTKEISEKFLAGHTSPITVYGNIHDTSITHLYLELNERLVSVVLDHRQEQKETLLISFNRGGVYDTRELKDLDWKKSSAWETVIDGTSWIFGTDREAVQKKITSRKNRLLSRRTDEEVNELLEQRTAELRRELESKDKQLEQVQRELKLTKDELKNTKVELENANDLSKSSYEQQILAMKLAAEQAAREAEREKQEFLREQERLRRERDYSQFEYGRRINEAKARKEDLSTKASEAASWANILKAMAVILPSLLTIMTFLSKNKAVS